MNEVEREESLVSEYNSGVQLIAAYAFAALHDLLAPNKRPHLRHNEGRNRPRMTAVTYANSDTHGGLILLLLPRSLLCALLHHLPSNQPISRMRNSAIQAGRWCSHVSVSPYGRSSVLNQWVSDLSGSTAQHGPSVPHSLPIPESGRCLSLVRRAAAAQFKRTRKRAKKSFVFIFYPGFSILTDSTASGSIVRTPEEKLVIWQGSYVLTAPYRDYGPASIKGFFSGICTAGSSSKGVRTSHC